MFSFEWICLNMPFWRSFLSECSGHLQISKVDYIMHRTDNHFKGHTYPYPHP